MASRSIPVRTCVRRTTGTTIPPTSTCGAAGFGLKVIAAEYETDDSPEKVKAFYEDKMKHFGTIADLQGSQRRLRRSYVIHRRTTRTRG